MTGTSLPSSFLVVTVLAYGKPVSSCTGNASKSLRTSTVGPAPFFITPTTPKQVRPVLSYLPTCSVTSHPAAFSSFATIGDEHYSCPESSGCVRKSLEMGTSDDSSASASD